MQRLAFKMKLKEGTLERYKDYHTNIWPELISLLKSSGISEYSIFYDAETNFLFGFQKSAGEAGSQDLSGHNIVKEWWRFMSDLMEVNDDNSPVSIPLEEVFYMP